jgi:multiple sugar transport system substrate-binding protein
MLIGGFITPNFPADLRDKLDLIPFPVIKTGLGASAEAPMNSAHVPARAKNVEGGKRFLAFMMRADVQQQFNSAMQTLPVNRTSGVGGDKFLAISQQVLSTAQGLTQYFDRDTNEEFAAIAMRGFQEFMVAPDRRDRIIADIEQARQRIFGRQ